MTAGIVVAMLVTSLVLAPDPPQSSSPLPASGEVIAGVRVHGNQVTPDADVVGLAGVSVGSPFEADTIARIHGRLEAAGRFRRVDVLKRFVSIADPSQILIVIVVDEGPVSVEASGDPDAPVRVVRRGRLSNMLFAPVLDGEEGYGVTYGVRLAWVDIGGERGRVAVPLTWGGWRRAGIEYERTFTTGPITRLHVGTTIGRRPHPAFDEPVDRASAWVRIERKLGLFRLGGTADWQRVRFGVLDDRLRSAAIDLTFDTRIDPILPRDAVYAIVSVEQDHVDARPAVRRMSVDARGYLGLVGQSVLVLRATREDASGPLPPYLQPMLGGWSNLRGFAPGTFIGERLVAGSIELRVPVTSPLRVGKLGVSVFVDAGKAYGYYERYRDQPLHTGIGAGVWWTVTAFQIGVGVAHAHGGSTRGTFGADLRF